MTPQSRGQERSNLATSRNCTRALDTNAYPAGLKVSDQQMAELQLKRDKFHGDWNYSLLPRG